MFSIERAQHANSQIRQYANLVGKRRKIDDMTVELVLTYLPIRSDATRSAALLSGQVDFVLDPPPPRRRQLADGRVGPAGLTEKAVG